MTVDRGYDGLGERSEERIFALGLGRMFRGVAFGGDALQKGHVRAGAEAAARSGKYDDAHLRIRVGGGKRVADLCIHLCGPSVQLVRAVEGDGSDAIGNIEEDLLTTHRWVLHSARGRWGTSFILSSRTCSP